MSVVDKAFGVQTNPALDGVRSRSVPRTPGHAAAATRGSFGRAGTGQDGERDGRSGARTGRLVVVSNRVPMPGRRAASGPGGLAVALEAALKEHGGIWFGWSGDSKPVIDADAVDRHESGRITFAVTDLTKRDVDEYYLGFSNRALWPICHYRLDLAHLSAKETDAYFRVNDTMARKLSRLLAPDDLIWVHDYHMIPVGAALRERGVDARIGFFLHIPWPPPEVASALPEYRRLLGSFTAYDLVGFQTPRDAENFGRCLVDEGLATALGEGWYEAGDRRFQVGAFPIGIDTEAFRASAAKAENSAAVRRMTATLGGHKLVIGVDRLDYSKGIHERISAFCALLRMDREERGRVTLLQVTPKSRSDVPEYKQIQQDVAAQVGEANGEYGDVDWTPIRYLNQNIPHVTLTGLYRAAQVGLVTPLRDGMNLVAKEYVACQSEADPGVLVLSRYAGAAFEMDGALLVNPYDATATALAIRQGLVMSLGERRERWSSMMARLDAVTVGDWWRGFVGVLADRSADHGGSAVAEARGFGG